MRPETPAAEISRSARICGALPREFSAKQSRTSSMRPPSAQRFHAKARPSASEATLRANATDYTRRTHFLDRLGAARSAISQVNLRNQEVPVIPRSGTALSGPIISHGSPGILPAAGRRKRGWAVPKYTSASRPTLGLPRNSLGNCHLSRLRRPTRSNSPERFARFILYRHSGAVGNGF